MITIQNEQLTVQINELGAELTSIKDNRTDYEFLWQGNKKSWLSQAPVLFPIVGSLKDGHYYHNGQTYEMGQHGFARRMQFSLQTATATSATLYLKSNEETLKQYPFEFSFQITYILVENRLSVSYEVLNPSSQEVLYYSVGGHPGFNVSHHVPLTGQPEFSNVSFTFDPAGTFYCVPIVKGRVDFFRARYEHIDDEPIFHKTFKRDAKIYQIPKNTNVILNDPDNGVKITMKPSQFDFLGIWSSYPKKAGFVCLEPWAGLTDTIDATGELSEKYAINQLKPSEIKTHDYTMVFEKN